MNDTLGRIEASQATKGFSGDSFGNRLLRYRASRDAAQYELQAVTSTVLASVRVAFFNVLRAVETIKVREQSLALLEEELKNARNRYEAGAGAQFDVLRAEVALANGRPPLITARNDLKIGIEELRQLLGFTNGRGENLQKVPEFIGELAFGDEQFALDQALDSLFGGDSGASAGDSGDVVDPLEPTEPTDPVEPTTPVTPVTPTEPTTPSGSLAPPFSIDRIAERP